ncbi:uncharacterized protein LOC100866250 [Apis florea]|uniref:uncharacterized protein LOC100866250 n=1 Tax=Apis florea TaxID=7463 RepID=UPI0012FF419E|nr:uncharacterized protein LOC100866250 [Apis florea]
MPYVSPPTDRVQAIQHQDILARKDSSTTSPYIYIYVMRLRWILFALVLGLCDARARRTTTEEASFLEKRLVHPQTSRQHQDLENAWDLGDLQKLDGWNRTESRNSNSLNTRQIYPTINPGDTNELPGPITGRPTPAMTPPAGCLSIRGQFPSPTSCSNYLNCWDETVTEQACPDGLFFNDVNLYCDYDYNVNCGNRPMPTPRPSLTDGSKLCPEPNGHYRSATNCSEFYVCLYKKPIKFGCPRGLVYNDQLGVCDYPYNVDCKGAVSPPLASRPTSPQVQPSQLPASISSGQQLPQQPSQQPSYAPSQPQQPSYAPSQPQQPSYAPSQPQQPSYAPSQPLYGSVYPQQPSYGASQSSYTYGSQSFSGNPWLSRVQPVPWNERTLNTQLEIDKEQHEREEEIDMQEESTEQLQNPWDVVQNIPSNLSTVPCQDGDVHKLNDACTNVVVCRNGRPQLLQCLLGNSYDRPSDSCKPISIAKC